MPNEGPQTNALAANAPTSQPRQGRSLASFERMIEATRSLMLERGDVEFTLQDVSQRGNVSIGSIYLRFESKDRLLHVVIARELNAIIAAEQAMLDGIVTESRSLQDFLTLYVERYSALLRDRAPMLRTIMQRASVDDAVAGPGWETALRSAAIASTALMNFRQEIRGGDSKDKAEALFPIIFAVIARQLGLSGGRDHTDSDAWEAMKRHLTTMALAFLRFES